MSDLQSTQNTTTTLEKLDPPISVCITNLGKYNEGILAYARLDLPTTKEKVQAALKQISVDGIRYEETFFSDWETTVDGLHNCIGEYDSLDELNYLAQLIQELPDHEIERLEAGIVLGMDGNSIKDMINLVQNLDCVDFYTDVHDHDDLGRYYIDECGALEVPEELQRYINYEAYGRDVDMNDLSTFTRNGYARATGDSITEYYHDRDDLPDDAKVFAYPRPEPKHRRSDHNKPQPKQER